MLDRDFNLVNVDGRVESESTAVYICLICISRISLLSNKI